MQKMLLLNLLQLTKQLTYIIIVNKSDVRASEMKSDEVKNLNTIY
jgi:hypothetical protein